MSIDLEFKPRAGYLLVEVTGEFQLDEAKKAFVRILDACIENKRSKVLVDIRGLVVQSPMRTLDSYEFAEAEARTAWDYLTRGLTSFQVAYVGTEDQIDPERFGETVATNRGLRALSTSDMAGALAWLGVAPDDEPEE